MKQHYYILMVMISFMLFPGIVNAGKYVPKDSTTMTGKVDREGRPIVLSRKWNGLFTYTTENLHSYSRVVNVSHNQTVSINVFPQMIAEEVIALWQVTTFPFATQQEEQPLSLSISEGRVATPDQVGVTNPLGETHSVIINMDNIVNHAIRDYDTSIREGYINQGDMSFESFVVLLTRLTLMHEIGHAMGLGHPHANTDPEQADFGGYFRVLIAADSRVPMPTIMVHDTRYYLQFLSHTLGRPVRYEDIRPSERDIRAANMMWAGPNSRSGMRLSLTCSARNGHCGIL